MKTINDNLKQEIASVVPENGRKPIPDGITNPELYAKAPVKILLILKEPYDKMADGSVGEGEWKHDEYLNDLTFDEIYYHRKPTEKRVSKLVSCIFRNISYSELSKSNLSEDEIMNDFKSIAWINVGKYPAPGNTASPDSRVRQQYGFWKDILFKQISAYQPEIIIFGKTFGLFFEDLKAELDDNLTGPFATPGDSDFAHYWIDTRNNRVLVQTYHPSFRYLKGCNGICYGGMSEQLYIDSIVNAIRASKA